MGPVRLDPSQQASQPFQLGLALEQCAVWHRILSPKINRPLNPFDLIQHVLRDAKHVRGACVPPVLDVLEVLLKFCCGRHAAPKLPHLARTCVQADAAVWKTRERGAIATPLSREQRRHASTRWRRTNSAKSHVGQFMEMSHLETISRPSIRTVLAAARGSGGGWRRSPAALAWHQPRESSWSPSRACVVRLARAASPRTRHASEGVQSSYQ